MITEYKILVIESLYPISSLWFMILFEVFLRAKKKKQFHVRSIEFLFPLWDKDKWSYKTTQNMFQNRSLYFVSQLLRTQDPSCLVVCHVTLSHSLRIVKWSLSSPFVRNSLPYICHEFGFFFFFFEAKENHFTSCFNSSFLNGKCNMKNSCKNVTSL